MMLSPEKIPDERLRLKILACNNGYLPLQRCCRIWPPSLEVHRRFGTGYILARSEVTELSSIRDVVDKAAD